MTLKTIYIARHGYRANWLPPPHPPNPTGVDSDPPLAPHGVEQAKELAKFVDSLPDKPQLIFSSPFYRCVETAQPIAQMTGIPIVLERGVGEWYKKNRGIVPEPVDYDILLQWFKNLKPDLWKRDGLDVIPDLTGETEEDIFNRASKFWQKFFPVFQERFPEIESILILTHAATKIALGMSLLGRSGVHDTLEDGTRLRAGACSIDRYEAQGSSWKLTMNGNCSFLSKGEEMHWNFESGFEAGSDEDIKARAAAAAAAAAASSSSSSNSGSGSIETTSDADRLDDTTEMEEIYVTIDIPVNGESKFLQFDDTSNLKTLTTKSSNLSKSKSSGSTASNSSVGSTVHGSVNDSNQHRQNVIKPSSEFQIANLEGEHPLIKLSNNGDITNSSSTTGDGKIFQAQWKKLVGTDLVFDDYGEVCGVVREHLECDENNVLIPKEKDEEEDDADEEIPIEGDAHATAIWKKLYAMSKKRENEAT